MIKYGLIACLAICSAFVNSNPASGILLQGLRVCSTRGTGISQRVRACSVNKDAPEPFDNHSLKVLSAEEEQLKNKLNEIGKSIKHFAEAGNSSTYMNRSIASSAMDGLIDERKDITDRLSVLSKYKTLLEQQKGDSEDATLFNIFDELSKKEQNLGKVLAIKDMEICQCDDQQEYAACLKEEQRLCEDLSNTRLEKATIVDLFLKLSENAVLSEKQKIMHKIISSVKQISEIAQYQDKLTQPLNANFAVIPDNKKEEFLKTITRIDDLTHQCALLKTKLSAFKKE